MTKANVNEEVRQFWEPEPNGSEIAAVGARPSDTREWYRRIEDRRYALEPFIHSVAQFTRHSGERILEIGVGAGTDHLQWARAGAICSGVDLTESAIEMTRDLLRMNGLTSDLKTADAEHLPFEDNAFDVVYSWGVIHHSSNPERIVAEAHRVLRPGGVFIGMLYGRHSIVALKLWIKFGLLRLQPWRSFSDVIWHQVESIGTKAYTQGELGALFHEFNSVALDQIVTQYDRGRLPRRLARLIPGSLGWFIAVRAEKARLNHAVAGSGVGA